MKQIKIKVKSDSHSTVKSIICAVVKEYPKFVLLDNGLYKFCVHKNDLRSGGTITV